MPKGEAVNDATTIAEVAAVINCGLDFEEVCSVSEQILPAVYGTGALGIVALLRAARVCSERTMRIEEGDADQILILLGHLTRNVIEAGERNVGLTEGAHDED